MLLMLLTFQSTQTWHRKLETSVIFVNENVEKRENNEFINENENEKMMKTKTKLKRKNRKRLKTKTKKSKTKTPK